MKENKYYIPGIEEFYIGFEYERFDSINDTWLKRHVLDNTYDGWNAKDVFKELEEGKVRVKSLDKKDIESLEFNCYKQHPGTTTYEFESKDEKYCLTFDPEFSKNWNITITDDGECGEEFIYFHGFIKNKSELKVLLKQLGIN